MRKMILALLFSVVLSAQDMPRAVAIVVHLDRPAWSDVADKPDFEPYVLVLLNVPPNMAVKITAFAGVVELVSKIVAVSNDPPKYVKIELPLKVGDPLPDRVETSVELTVTNEIGLDAPF